MVQCIYHPTECCINSIWESKKQKKTKKTKKHQLLTSGLELTVRPRCSPVGHKPSQRGLDLFRCSNKVRPKKKERFIILSKHRPKQVHCYGVKVCVSTKSICWNLSPQCDGTRRWVFFKSWPSCYRRTMRIKILLFVSHYFSALLLWHPSMTETVTVPPTEHQTRPFLLNDCYFFNHRSTPAFRQHLTYSEPLDPTLNDLTNKSCSICTTSF